MVQGLSKICINVFFDLINLKISIIEVVSKYRIIYLIIIIFIFSLCAQAKEKNNMLNKKEIVILGLTLVNPAISIGTIVSNTTTFQKIISMANIVYTNRKGHSIAETAISQSTNKNCLIKNIRTKKYFCI